MTKILNMLKPFDKILIIPHNGVWCIDVYSHYVDVEIFGEIDRLHYDIHGHVLTYAIPYNEQTKHLLGTTDDVPKQYKNYDKRRNK